MVKRIIRAMLRITVVLTVPVALLGIIVAAMFEITAEQEETKFSMLMTKSTLALPQGVGDMTHA